MESQLNTIEKGYALLQKIISTRFGCFVLGVAVTGFGLWFFYIKNFETNIEDCRTEKSAKDKEIQSLNATLQETRTLAQNSYANGHKDGVAYAEDLMDRALNNIERIQSEIPYKISKASKELKATEIEIKQRKEVLKNE